MEGGIFPCSLERRDDCLRKIGGSEGLLTEKLFFTVADLLDLLLLRRTEADLLRVCRTVPCGRFALLRLALRPRRIISEGDMTPREDGGRALMARRKIC